MIRNRVISERVNYALRSNNQIESRVTLLNDALTLSPSSLPMQGGFPKGDVQVGNQARYDHQRSVSSEIAATHL